MCPNTSAGACSLARNTFRAVRSVFNELKRLLIAELCPDLVGAAHAADDALFLEQFLEVLARVLPPRSE